MFLIYFIHLISCHGNKKWCGHICPPPTIGDCLDPGILHPPSNDPPAVSVLCLTVFVDAANEEELVDWGEDDVQATLMSPS